MLADTDMRRAVRARDPSADGAFFYAVLSTGVFCYPSCAARPALPENLRFFPTRQAAAAAGYRPCQRCRPELAPRAVRERDAVADACRAIDAGVFEPAQAAADAGLTQPQLARAFRRIAGVTLGAYERARRQRVVQAALGSGARVTETLYAAGFGSSGRFYEAADGMLGMTPTAWRAGGAGEVLHHATGQSWLGRVLVAATARGICAILIGASDEVLLEDLAARFPKAALAEAGPAFAGHLRDVLALIEAPEEAHALPLDIAGTLFQQRVWRALRQIPAGTTLSYGELAARLGAPKAARAVAAACAANKLAVAVPCHRVVAGDGALAGYRWGVERKRALLEREA
jgi:AraC family transcriptional regulator of adaptative response/methylated-DNA-[protein]-cysteine methyltransferase